MLYRFSILCSLLILASCSCPKSFSVNAVKVNDKDLTCKDIVLEINEAEFYRRKSENNKDSNLETYLNPLCYPSTFISADKAARAAQARLEYLNEIYDLKGCDIEMRKIREEQRRGTVPADQLLAPSDGQKSTSAPVQPATGAPAATAPVPNFNPGATPPMQQQPQFAPMAPQQQNIAPITAPPGTTTVPTVPYPQIDQNYIPPQGYPYYDPQQAPPPSIPYQDPGFYDPSMQQPPYFYGR